MKWILVVLGLLAIQGEAKGKRLKGAKDNNLNRRALQYDNRAPNLRKLKEELSPEPRKHGGSSETYAYTWDSADPPNSVTASVSRSKYDDMMAKMKSKEAVVKDDSPDHEPKSSTGSAKNPPTPKSSNTSTNSAQNRPPQPLPGNKGSGTNKAGGSYKTGGGANKGSDKNDKANKSYHGNKKTKSSTKEGGSKKAGGDSGGGGGSYGGGSYDSAVDNGDSYYEPTGGSKQSQNKSAKSNGSAKSGGSYKSGGSSKSHSSDSEIDTPPSRDGPTSGSGETGVSVSRYSLLYYIDESLGMPMTLDYEAVHENTYLWLYTVMYQRYGDKMVNLLTDDTSNIYESGQPVTIEYTSVVMFDSEDPDIPSKEELNSVVFDAFTGSNLETYINGIQALPSSNPFSSTTIVEFQTTAGTERSSSFGGFSSRISTKALMSPLIAAASILVVLAGGAAVYRARQAEFDDKDKAIFDSFSRGGTENMADEFTSSIGSASIRHNLPSDSEEEEDDGEDDLRREVKTRQRSPRSSERALDPDLRGWSEFFDSPDSPKEIINTCEDYSIEDFVNEAERNLLGVRIRYPSEPRETKTVTNETTAQDDATSSALVPASTALVPASTALVPASSALVPAPSDIITRTSI